MSVARTVYRSLDSGGWLLLRCTTRQLSALYCTARCDLRKRSIIYVNCAVVDG